MRAKAMNATVNLFSLDVFCASIANDKLNTECLKSNEFPKCLYIFSQGGETPPTPSHSLPCNCPPGQGLSPDLPANQTCERCRPGKYGAGGEIINNWQDWTNNGTTPPEGSPLITYCEISRDYVKFCEAWKASGKHNLL